MLVDPDNLMGRAEIGQLLGVGYTRARQIIGRPDFPRPVKRLIGMWIWDGAQVEAWIREHRPAITEEDPEDA